MKFDERFYVNVADLMLTYPHKKLFAIDEHVPLTSVEVELWSEVVIIGNNDD